MIRVISFAVPIISKTDFFEFILFIKFVIAFIIFFVVVIQFEFFFSSFLSFPFCFFQCGCWVQVMSGVNRVMLWVAGLGDGSG